MNCSGPVVVVVNANFVSVAFGPATFEQRTVKDSNAFKVGNVQQEVEFWKRVDCH